MEKNSKKIEIISFVVLVVLIVALGLTLYLRRNSITNVNKVLSNKYDEIKCVDDSCEYLTVLKNSKNKVYVYDSYGARISKFENNNSRTLYAVTPSYMLFKNLNKKGEVKTYEITRPNGKSVYKTSNEITKLTDYLVSEKDGDAYKVVNYKGKVLYSNISRLKRYSTVSQIKVLDDEYLIDERGDRILTDYLLEKEVRNENEETLYIILRDSSKAYYYFDISTGKIKGDSFTSYGEFDESYNAVIYKKKNGETIKYILKNNGDQYEDGNDSQVKLVKKVKENLDEKYSLYEQSLFSNSQTKILVDNKEDNSFGIFDIQKKKYKKIYDYKNINGSSIILNFDSYDGNKYFQISCLESMCGAAKVTVYDANNGEVLYEYTSGENKVRNYTGLADGYKLIKYTSDSTAEYSDKYVLYDKNNNQLVVSEKLINVVDKKVLFGKKYDEDLSIIYSAKLKKVLNSNDTLAETIKVDSAKIYRYSDDDYTYLVSESGDELFKVKNSLSNLVFADDVILNIKDKNVEIIDAKNSKVGKYKFAEGENMINEVGQNITTYKNSIFINNTKENYGKIVDFTGTKLKKLKKMTIKDVKYSKKSNNVILITGSGKKYGLYIAK